ncbi:hypothetical protein P3X46_010354 [Hevea brasiliensis]|uniref:Uncharacterized protein n=1 Tax=Hevea brasiliensis TaxID=3981 RepID=A0ABQ9MGI4_HEVBR|nr:hypothetical protein P3X46_010354 [Hevea brasiliensis]
MAPELYEWDYNKLVDVYSICYAGKAFCCILSDSGLKAERLIDAYHTFNYQEDDGTNHPFNSFSFCSLSQASLTHSISENLMFNPFIVECGIRKPSNICI